MDYCLITFSSSNGAIQAQRVLKGHLPFQVMPVLREVSASCGIALRLAPDAVEQARSVRSRSELRADEYAFYGVSGRGAALTAQRLFL